MPSNLQSQRITRYGIVIGAFARGLALCAYVLPLLVASEVPTRVLVGLPLAIAPSMVIGAVIGAILGRFHQTWQRVIVGAALSMLTFVLWSAGPFEWWVLHIAFNFQLTIYFGIAGAFTGFLPAVLWNDKPLESPERNDSE